ncbi:MAG: autotransporter-associated beta strand repeat-containing protein [Phycisphaeraceae bacterium]|nr:autotransporter-associated beta strand repeat-containing protein [Phycisphaeraceae bacterium]
MRKTLQLARRSSLLVILLAGYAGSAGAATFTWDGSDNDGDWGNANNWSSAPAFDGTDDIVFYSTLGTDTTTTLGANRDINSLTFNAGASSAFSIDGDTLTIESGNITRNSGGGNHTINSDVVLGNNGTWYNGTGTLSSMLVVNGVVSGGFNITKTGAGTLSLTNTANSYTGQTILSQGVLRIYGDAPSGSNGVLGNTTSAVVMGTTSSGSSTIKLSQYNGSTTVGRDIHVTNNGTGAVLIGTYSASNVVYSGDILMDRATTLNTEAGGSATFSGVISGVGALRRDGNSANVAIINGVNTYTGNTYFDYGYTYVVGNVAPSTDGPLGNSANPIQFTNTGGGIVGLMTHGSYTISRDITITAGGSGRKITFAASAAGAGVITVPIVLADTIRLGAVTGSSLTFTNTLSGNPVGDLTIGSGSGFSGGTVSLAGNNTYTLSGGGVVLLDGGGLLNIAHDSALGNSANLLRFANGALSVTGNRTIANPMDVFRTPSFGGTGSLTVNGTTTLRDGTYAWGVYIPVTLNGTVTDAAQTRGITKSGTSVLNLAAPGGNTYDGATSVTQGTLLVNNTSGSATGTGTVTVASGATLGGNGRILGSTSISNGGIVSPGNSAGLLTIDNNFSFGGTLSQFVVELDGFGAYDQLAVNGTVTLNNATLSAISIGVVPDSSLLFILINDNTDAISGTFNGLADGATVSIGGLFSGTAKISYFGDSGSNSITGGNDVVLYNFQNVPEPTSLALLALSGMVMMRRRRVLPSK